MVDYPYTHYLDPSVFVWGQSLPNYPIKCVKRIKRALSLALFTIGVYIIFANLLVMSLFYVFCYYRPAEIQSSAHIEHHGNGRRCSRFGHHSLHENAVYLQVRYTVCTYSK